MIHPGNRTRDYLEYKLYNMNTMKYMVISITTLEEIITDYERPIAIELFHSKISGLF
jgi:hypothetical protein